MNQLDLFYNRDRTSICTVEALVRPAAVSDEQEIDRLIQETQEAEIIELGWLRVANGYVGPPCFTPSGKAIVLFWRYKDHEKTNAPADLPAVAGKVRRDVGRFRDWIADKEAEYRMSGFDKKKAKEKAMEDWYLYEEPNASFTGLRKSETTKEK